MSSRRIVAAALAAALTLTATACGDDDDAAPVAGDDASVEREVTDDDAGDALGDAAAGLGIDACELVTAAEAEAALGLEVDLSATTDEPLSCVYDTTESGAFTLAIVQVSVEPGGLVGTDLELMAEMAAGFTDDEGELESVDLGDGAFVITEGLVPMLFAAVGDDLLTVSVVGAEDDGAAMVELAGIAVGRL